jgi:hypothetical protein
MADLTTTGAIKMERFSVTQTMLLLFHSQHVLVQAGYHQVICKKYNNDDGIP